MEEVIKTYEVEDGTEIDLVGVKENDSDEEYDFFDLFISDTGECLNEGDPLYSRPTQSQVDKIYKEFIGDL